MLIDIILAALVIYGFFIGYTKGIIKTVLYTVAIVMGLVAGIKFAPVATTFLEGTFNFDSSLSFIAGFLTVFLGTILVIRLIARGIEGFFKTTHINFVNQLIGGALTAAFFAFLYSAVITFADSSHLISDKAKAESKSFAYLMPFRRKSMNTIKTVKPSLKKYWDESMQVMEKVKNKAEENVNKNKSDVFDPGSGMPEKKSKEEEKQN